MSKGHFCMNHNKDSIMTRVEFTENASPGNRHSFLLLDKESETMGKNNPKADIANNAITPTDILHLFELVNKPNFITQCLPVLIKSLRTMVNPQLIAHLESYYGNTIYWLLDAQSAQVYLSIADHVYAYKGDIGKDSILYPHHLGLQIIATLESFNERMGEDGTLVNKVWKVFVTLRDKLIHQLLHLRMYSMLPSNSVELVITCLYEKHVKGGDFVTVELFSHEFCGVLDKLNVNNVFESIIHKNRLSKSERICALYALYQHYSFINPVVIDEWKIKIAEKWADERLFLVSSMESQEILTLSVACTLGYVCKEDAMKYHCLMQGVTMRMSSLDERTRSMAMVIGEMMSKLLPTENGLKFQRTESEFSRLLYWAFRFGDVVQQSGRCTVPYIEAVECIEDSDDEGVVHEDIKLRNKYIGRGESIPKHKTHLIEPKNLQQALDWFTADKDRVKTTLAVDHMHRLICMSSALYMNANYMEVAKVLLTVPNAYNLPNYETELQKCFKTILNAPWVDNNNRQQVDNVRKGVLNMMHKMWYGDMNEKYRTLMLNLHQRLHMFTRIVMCIDDQIGNSASKSISSTDDTIMEGRLENKYPLLKRIEQAHKKEGSCRGQITNDNVDLAVSVTEHFLIPFLKQSSMEYTRFFNQSHCNLILERTLLFTALVMDKVNLQPIYVDLVQRVLVFVRQALLTNHDGSGESLNEKGNLKEVPMIKAVLFNLRQMVNRWPGVMDPFSYAPVLMDIEKYLADIGDTILGETEASNDHHQSDGDESNGRLLAVLWTSTMQGIRELTDTKRLLEKRLQELELEGRNEIRQVSIKPFIRIT